MKRIRHKKVKHCFFLLTFFLRHSFKLILKIEMFRSTKVDFRECCFCFQRLSPLYSHTPVFSATEVICLCLFFSTVWEVIILRPCEGLDICTRPGGCAGVCPRPGHMRAICVCLCGGDTQHTRSFVLPCCAVAGPRVP